MKITGGGRARLSRAAGETHSIRGGLELDQVAVRIPKEDLPARRVGSHAERYLHLLQKRRNLVEVRHRKCDVAVIGERRIPSRSGLTTMWSSCSPTANQVPAKLRLGRSISLRPRTAR